MADYVHYRGFERAVTAAIIANVVVLVAGLIIDGYEEEFEVAHNVILIFFVAELTLRLHGARWRVREFLLASRWNAFDSAAIALSLLPLLGVDASLLRVARLARMLHLLRHASSLRAVRLVSSLVR